MKVSLVVNRVEKSTETNLAKIHHYIKEAVSKNCDLVMFPEACITGLINNDDPTHDLTLGISLESTIIKDLCNLARLENINISLGIFERVGNKLYDSALYIDRCGEISVKYRRVSSGWHGLKVDKDIYKEGSEVNLYETEFGSICFLICGDLFDDALVKKVHELNPDYLLFPFARAFIDGSKSQAKFEIEEIPDYKKQVIAAGVTTLMVNYIDDEYFGGAFVLSEKGEILAKKDLGQEGMLIIELKK